MPGNTIRRKPVPDRHKPPPVRYDSLYQYDCADRPYHNGKAQRRVDIGERSDKQCVYNREFEDFPYNSGSGAFFSEREYEHFPRSPGDDQYPRFGQSLRDDEYENFPHSPYGGGSFRDRVYDLFPSTSVFRHPHASDPYYGHVSEGEVEEEIPRLRQSTTKSSKPKIVSGNRTQSQHGQISSTNRHSPPPVSSIWTKYREPISPEREHRSQSRGRRTTREPEYDSYPVPFLHDRPSSSSHRGGGSSPDSLLARYHAGDRSQECCRARANADAF